MRTFQLGVLVIFAIAGQWSIAQHSAAADGRAPVLVELFTSEGCSDCPDADRLLDKLVDSQPVAGAQIIGLEEHVDYFNNPAHWVDPYSSTQVTNRQYDYANKFNDNSVYTPEMVVDGSAHFVGSDSDSAEAAILAASALHQATINIRTLSAGGGASEIRVTVTNVPPGISNDKVSAIVVVTEDGLVSHVTGGENTGRTLPHSSVVRSFSFAGYLSGQPSDTFQTSLTVPAAWKDHPLHAVAFLQNVATKRIYGCAEISL